MTEMSDMIAERVAMIREAAEENLRSAGWLEHEFLPQLGFHHDARQYLPKSLGPYCGAGLRSFQAPNQLSKYLVNLSGRRVSTYLEMGVAEGGTFVITVEYLSRFSATPIAALGIDTAIQAPLIAYAKINGNVKLVESLTNNPQIAPLLSRRLWDLVFIDADHTELGCTRDFELVRENSRLVAFHDIFNDVCPEVELVWNRVRQIVPRRSTWEFIEQYVEMIRTRNQRLFGIGLLELCR